MRVCVGIDVCGYICVFVCGDRCVFGCMYICVLVEGQSTIFSGIIAVNECLRICPKNVVK